MLWISMKHIDVTNPWWEVDCGSSSLPFRNVWIPWEVLAAGVHASLAKELQSLSSSTCVGWFVWKCGFWMFLGDLFKGVSLSFIFIWNLEQLEQPYFWRYLQLTVYIFRHIWILLNFAVGLQYVLQSFLHSPACARSWREVVQTSPQLHLTYVKGSACEKDGWWPSLTIDHGWHRCGGLSRQVKCRGPSLHLERPALFCLRAVVKRDPRIRRDAFTLELISTCFSSVAFCAPWEAHKDSSIVCFRHERNKVEARKRGATADLRMA